MPRLQCLNLWLQGHVGNGHVSHGAGAAVREQVAAWTACGEEHCIEGERRRQATSTLELALLRNAVAAGEPGAIKLWIMRGLRVPRALLWLSVVLGASGGICTRWYLLSRKLLSLCMLIS